MSSFQAPTSTAIEKIRLAAAMRRASSQPGSSRVWRTRHSRDAAPVDCEPMSSSGEPTPGSLTLVLPAYDEAERIGPALDELYAYLDAVPRPAGLPGSIDVLVVDDGSRDATASIVEARPEARLEARRAAAPADGADGGPHAPLHLLRVPHAGKGAAVRAGMLAAAG